ncbi:GumC domain-containing protein [Microcella flavibacter]|uniref:hypothetical protein n=1 Tax=Microcella flavibacter TaxID=1804990 RepID=UPI0014570FD5|nr:hypothetical protein [Microcella flavibacter]
MIVDPPFILRDRAYWPLVAVIGICTIGLTVIGIGFGILSSMLSGGQITEVQRPTRSAIVPWPFVTPPALLTIVAAALALGASILLAARTSVRTSGFLTTTFGWSLAGMLGAGALAVAFPNARVGGSALIPGLSDHAIGAAGFALGAVTSILGQTRLQTGYTAARAAGLNPAFFPIVPPQGASLVPELHIEAPPMWRWILHDGRPAIARTDDRPAPMRIVVPDRDAPPLSDPAPTAAAVNGAPTRREIITDSSGGTIMRYRYQAKIDEPERVIEIHITATSDRHSMQAYRDCADLIAGSVRWTAVLAEKRRRPWWRR